MPEQTVEDLGKLVIQKYPDAYGKMNPIEIGRKVREKYPDAYGQFKDIPSGFVEKARSVLSVGNPSTSPSELKKINERREKGIENIQNDPKFKAAAIGGAVLDPAMAIAENPAGAVNFAKSAYQGLKVGLPKLMGGATSLGIGEGLAKMGFPQARYLTTWPGVQMAAQGVKEGAKSFANEFSPAGLGKFFSSESTVPEAFAGKVVSPQISEEIKQKGPTQSMLVDAVKSGHMSMEQFDQEIGKLGYSSEAQQIIRQNTLSKISPKGSVVPGETPKTLSVSDMKLAVKNGLMNLDEFEGELQQLGYNEKSRGVMRSLLEKSLKSEEGEEGIVAESPVKTGELKVNFPGTKTPEKAPGISEEKLSQSLQKGQRETTLPHDEEGNLTDEAKEKLQAPARAAKENKLAAYLAKSEHDLDNMKPTSDLLNSLGKEADLKYKPSLRTFEAALEKAKQIRSR